MKKCPLLRGNVWRRLCVRVPVAIIVLVLGVSSAGMHCAVAAAAETQSADSALLPVLLARLRQHDTVKVQFNQQKILRILKKPLRSSGSLLFWRGRGMVWQVATPVAATYVLTAQGMREIVAGNPQLATAEQNSAAPRSTNSAMPNLLPLFDAIFAGDEATLAQHFDYRATGTQQQWHLALVPRDELLLRIFSRLELDGRDYIDTLVLFDTRGDQTRIDLHDPQFDSSKFGADETSLLP